jgi:membrane protease YdiL (CAAX protease family)
VEQTWPAPTIPSSPPAGWFPDPYGGPNLRYWDGTRWTPLQASTGKPAREEFVPLPVSVAVLAVVVTAVSLTASKYVVQALADHYQFPIAVFVLIAALVGYGPLLICCRFAVNRWGTGSIRNDLGFKFKVVDIGWGPLTWFACMAAQFAVAIVIYAFHIPIESNTEGVSKFASDRTYVISFAILAVVAAPLVEELVFRGMILRGLRSRLSTSLSVGTQGVLFGAAHIDPIRGTGNIGLVMILSAVGIVLGGSAYLLRRLAPTMISHALTNTLALVFVLTR